MLKTLRAVQRGIQALVDMTTVATKKKRRLSAWERRWKRKVQRYPHLWL